MECVRTCPYDNIALNVRAPGSDLLEPRGRRLDEAYKAFIMLGAAIVYSAVMLGPWSALKIAAYGVGSLAWTVYVAGFLVFVLVVLPGLFLLAVHLGCRLAGRVRPRKAFTNLSYSLVPLGLAAWIAFSVSFALANGSYAWPVLSDPLGWGWDLVGLREATWSPYLTGLVGPVQATVLLGGFAWTGISAKRIAGQLVDEGGASESGDRLALPIVLFGLLVTLVLLALFVA